MYNITVPIINRNVKRIGKENLLEELKRFDAKRVMLALGSYELDEEKRKKVFEELAENCAFFKSHGYEVGTWFWAFLMSGEHGFKNMRSIKGTEITECVCPTDESFVKFAAGFVADAARCGVDLILFDDDLRYGFISDSPACLCDAHIAEINRITGECSTREELEKYITSGGKNKYRDAYLKAGGDALRGFAMAMRESLNTVNPRIRMGACACLTSWDIDGTDAREISLLLAGDTKPFMRLIGAPYWAVGKAWGNMLEDVIELERMEISWTRQGGMEILAEGDVYPRPRTLCPASYLEGFDTAIRASGCTDGIIKYGIDFYSNTDYEVGYARFHEKNREIYKGISELFDGKESVGVRVYESMKKLSDMVMPTKVNSEVNIEDLFFSRAARTLAYNTIPTVWEGEGVTGIVFDENARNLPLDALKRGLIIDVAAAEILSERGIDVGIEEIGAETKGDRECFVKNGNIIPTAGVPIYELKLKEGAEILSTTETKNGKIPVSYRYENAEGNRFLVLNINTRSSRDQILKNYERSAQYAENIPWLSGEKLPAYVYGSPALYIQCKKSEDTMSVGLWNFFADEVLSPKVELDGEYSSIKCLGCKGELCGDAVMLSDIPAFGFAFFEVKKG